MKFYQEHRDSNVVLHSDDEHRAAAARGMHFVVVRGTTIVAASLVVPVGDTEYLEGGNTLIAPSLRGFGLQRLLIRIRSVAVFAEGPRSTFVIGADPKANQVSFNNLIREGFQPLPPPVHPAFLELCKQCDKRPLPPRCCCCTFMCLEGDGHRRAVARFLDNTPVVDLFGKSGQHLRVRTEYLWATNPQLRNALKQFAGVSDA